MNEALFLMACATPPLLLVVAAVVLIWSRTMATARHRAERRVVELEHHTTALLQRLSALESHVAGTSSARLTAPAAAPTPTAISHAPAVDAGPLMPPPTSYPAAAAPPYRSSGRTSAHAVPQTAHSPHAPLPDAPFAQPRLDPVSPDPLPSDAPTARPAAGGAWERWIGVRGAAAAGAGALVLAGAMFFQLSLEQGWLSPALRVALGVVAGLALALVSEWPIRARHPLLASWLAGAAGAILYFTIWAATVLFDQVSPLGGVALMTVVTVSCAIHAVRRHALPVACLGLLGGFATPLLLAGDTARPLELFGYLLVLHVGVSIVASVRRWPALVTLSVLATAAYQALWIGFDMEPHEAPLGVVIVLAFAALGLFGASRTGKSPALAMLLPFAFALLFAVRRDLDGSFLFAGVVAVSLVAGSHLVARHPGTRWLPTAATAAAFAVMAVFLVVHGHSLDIARVWDLAAATLAVGALAGVRASAHSEARLRVALATIGGLLVFAAAIACATASIVWLVVLAALTAHGAWAAIRAGDPRMLLATAGAAAGAVLLGYFPRTLAPELSAAVVGGMVAALALTWLLVGALLAHARRGDGRIHEGGIREAAEHSAAATACAALAPLLAASPQGGLDLVVFAAVHGGATMIALIAATRRGAPVWSLVALLLSAAVVSVSIDLAPSGTSALLPSITAVATLLVCALVALGLPFARGPYGQRAGAWRVAAIALPLAAGPFYFGVVGILGPSVTGLAVASLALPVLVALAAVDVLGRPQTPLAIDEALGRTARTWLAAGALGIVTLSIVLSLSNEWITIALALEGLAVLALHHRVDHTGLKAFGLALFATVTVRLVLNPFVFTYHPTGGVHGWVWLSYAYGIPIVCAILGAAILGRREHERLRAPERELLGLLGRWAPKSPGAQLLAAAAVVLGFVWIDLTIFAAFASGPRLSIPTERLPARDLALSLAWGVYSLLLLAIGMRRASTPLRLGSLSLLVLTACKIFLLDVGHLDPLYRIGSLVGLALSLIVVSLAYQRFVFGPRGWA